MFKSCSDSAMLYYRIDVMWKMIALTHGINNFKMPHVLKNETEMELERNSTLTNIINVCTCTFMRCSRTSMQTIWPVYDYLEELCCGIITTCLCS